MSTVETRESTTDAVMRRLATHWVVAASVILYVVLFFVLAGSAGGGPITAVIPVMAIAHRFGMRAGLLAGVGTVFTNIALSFLVEGSITGRMPLEIATVVGTLAIVVIGGVVGRLRDLGGELVMSRTAVKRLRRRLDFEDLVANLAVSLLSADVSDLDQAILRAQEAVARFLGAERSTIQAFGDPRDPTLVLSRWAAPGVSVASIESRSRPPEEVAWGIEMVVVKKEPIIGSSLDEFPPEAQLERELLAMDDVRSFLAYPLVYEDQTFAVLSFETVTRQIDWSSDDIANLGVAAQMFVAALQRSRADRQLAQMNRVLEAITACNESLVRATEERPLLDDICRIIVSQAGYRLAWVALIDLDGTISIGSRWGDDQGYLESLDLESPEAAGHPALLAMDTRHNVNVPDLGEGASGEPWRAGPAAHGYLSVLALPLVSGNETLGALVVDCSRPHAFDGEASALLTQLADDLAFGIAAIRTDAKRREAEDRLTALVRSKDQFVASVAHELRTPLAAVVGLSQELDSRPEIFSSEERDELIQIIAHESTEVAGIVDDLLVIARADMGKVRVAPERVDVAAEIDSVVGSLPPSSRHRITITRCQASVWADPSRVRQVVRNLIGNALRHGGERIETAVSVLGDRVITSVSDDGPPIPEQRRHEMFEPYVGADRETLTASIGLGLAVSRTLANLMDGDLRYRHDDGWGVFELDLPRAHGSESDCPERTHHTAVEAPLPDGPVGGEGGI